MQEFKALKRFANGRDDKKQLVVYQLGKKYKADKQQVTAWAKRGWVEIVKPKGKE